MLRNLFLLFTVGVLAACSQGETGAQSIDQSIEMNMVKPDDIQGIDEIRKITGMQITDVSAVEAAELLKARPDIIVLDVRTPGEFAAGHIEGALNIDFKNANFATEIGKLDTAKTYLVHCRSGARSTRSLPVFKENGFKTIIHMNGGIMDWNKSGLPTVQ